LQGFDSLMLERRVGDLARLYSLCARVQGLDTLRLAFKDHIKKYGLQLVMDEEKVRAHGHSSSHMCSSSLVST
jgi:hypothetical protein